MRFVDFSLAPSRGRPAVRTMRWPALLPLLALGLACSDGTLLQPDATADLLLASTATPKYVPIHGEAELMVDPTAGFVPCLLGTTVVASFPARLTSEGVFSHLGRTTSDNYIDQCTVNSEGSLVGAGHADHTAANGDVLRAVFTAEFSPASGTAEAGEINWNGGTGRFENASGTTAFGGMIDLATGTGRWWFEGTISMVGSNSDQ